MFGLGAVNGAFDVESGHFTVATSLDECTLTATISASSIATGSNIRDTQVRGKAFLDAARFPIITFHSSTLRDSHAGWVVPGYLTVKGQKAPLNITITEAQPVGEILKITAQARVDRYAHGVTAMKGMAGRYLDLDITAVGVRTTAQ
jgi:polyisoprenoid-binding protein YceI